MFVIRFQKAFTNKKLVRIFKSHSWKSPTMKKQYSLHSHSSAWRNETNMYKYTNRSKAEKEIYQRVSSGYLGHRDLEWFLFSTFLSCSTYNFSTLNNLLPFMEKNTFKAIFPPWGDSRSCLPLPTPNPCKRLKMYSLRVKQKVSGVGRDRAQLRTEVPYRVRGCLGADAEMAPCTPHQRAHFQCPLYTQPPCLHPPTKKQKHFSDNRKGKNLKIWTYPRVSPTKMFDHMAPQWTSIDKPPIT